MILNYLNENFKVLLNKNFLWILFRLASFSYLYLYNSQIIDAIADLTIVKYCNSTAPSPLLLPTNEAIIHFHSDNIDTDAGFQIYYSTEERVPGCGGTYTAKQGTITSPNSLVDSISCEYDIKMPMSESIRIEFKKVELGEDDCLEVRKAIFQN